MKKLKPCVRKLICIITAAVLALSSASVLVGCSLFNFGVDEQVEFSVSSLSLEYGETRDISGLIRGNTDNYSLSSSNTTVVSVDGTVLTAHKTGRATVTASAGGSVSKLSVRVNEKNSFAIVPDGALIQTVGETSEIRFGLAITGETLKLDQINWSVNGKFKVEDVYYANDEYKFTPSEAGEYVIHAECNGAREYGDDVTVRVYNPVEASGSVDGELIQQAAPYSPITLTAAVGVSAANPDDYVVWKIDGEPVYEGSDKTFSYTPVPGYHTLTLEVNGVKRLIDGKEGISLTVYGSVVPTELEFVYDNMYPRAYLKSNVYGKAQVEITAPDGTVKEFSQASSLYRDLFDANGFNAAAYVEMFSAVSGVYKFRVKSLGDGELIKESGYSDYIEFKQLPSGAKSYWSQRYYDKDHFITSVDEYINILEYYVITRKKTTSRPRVSFDCYIAFDLPGDAEDLWNNAFPIAATSGRYDDIKASISRNVMHTSFVVDTVNNPSKQTATAYSELGGNYAKQLHAIIPHINFDEDKYRSENHRFPIDEIINYASVTYTDELYLAAENNTRPVPVKGSAADTVYTACRDVLRKIITDDMTDAEKAHAIYDWVMWQVIYDTPATEKDYDGEAYSAYYLEGVFGNGSTSIGGVKYYPYAVCDGISKAYSLMCNIEGIPCVRVAGMAGTSKTAAGGHAWNKVFIDGSWYVADCTWGDSVAELRIDGKTDDYELGLHDYLFLTDAEADETHFEPYEFGETDFVYAPETGNVKYDVFANMTYNGTAIDCHVRTGDNKYDKLSDIAKAFAKAYTPRDSIYVPGGKNNGIYDINYEAIDIYVDDFTGMTDDGIKLRIKSAITAARPSLESEVLISGNIILVMIRER